MVVLYTPITFTLVVVYILLFLLTLVMYCICLILNYAYSVYTVFMSLTIVMSCPEKSDFCFVGR